MKNLSALFLFTITSALLTSSQLASATEPSSLLQICTEIHDAQGDMPVTPRLKLFWDLLRVKAFPSTLVKTREIRLPIADAHRVQPVPGSLASFAGYNVIFSIDPPQDVLDSADLDAMKLRYAELNRKIKVMLPELRGIASASSVVQCVARAEKSSFDFASFEKLAEERNSLRILDQVKEAAKADQIIERTLGHLKLQWQVVHSTDLMAVHRALSHPGLKNVVILSHGLTGGKLVDSRLSEYPLGFFSDLSPELRSISIFACHGEDIVKTYHLETLVTSTLSEAGTRRIFVSDGTSLAGMEDLVPIAAFRHFMRHVDHTLFEVPAEEPMGPLESTPASCEAHFTGLDITHGTFGFALNGQFIGSANAGDHDLVLTYPCAIANRARNILVIHGISLLGPSAIESLDFQIVPVVPGKKIKDPTLKNYMRADGTYQSSLYEFGLTGI